MSARLFRIFSVVACVLALASMSWARPGGGQSYRSSGSSGGSRSGSSYGSGGSRSGSSWGSSGSRSGGSSYSSGGGSSYSGGGTTYSGSPGSAGPVLLGFFVVGGVILLVIVFAARGNRQAGSVRSALLDAQYDQEARSRRSVSIDVLQAHDPQLTEASILDRVRRMSDVLRDAWMAGDMRPARPFMSDGTFSRFQVQLELMKSEGVRNVMSDTQVLYVTLEAVQQNAPLDIVHVRFTAQARDATVPLQSTPQQVQQELARTPVSPYTEIWTLVRRQGAQTRMDAQQVGRVCPACGAPFDPGGEIVKCRYCSALVCSGEHDWVLGEITQLSEWHPNSADPVPGLDGLREVDLGVTRETLEDRASYLFWKWIESGRTRSAAPLRKAATPDLFARGGDGAQVAESARDIAVGGADVVLCDVARTGEAEVGKDVDYVYVKVFWSARFAPGAEPFPRQSLLRLARRSGMSTKLSMTAVVCPNCGGPLAETDDPRCSHCGADVVATGQMWALDAVMQPGPVRPRAAGAAPGSLEALVPDVRDPRERVALFSQMAQMLVSSGLQRREKRLLVECGKRWSIPEEVVGRALSGQLVGQAGPITSPEWFLAGLVGAALIDGTIDAQERDTLQRVCASLNLPPQALEQQIASMQQRMAQGALPPS
jgi:hypothetical protein